MWIFRQLNGEGLQCLLSSGTTMSHLTSAPLTSSTKEEQRLYQFFLWPEFDKSSYICNSVWRQARKPQESLRLYGKIIGI
jgi:hypothetical protein